MTDQASYPKLAAWLHRKGVARIINSECTAHGRGRAYAQGTAYTRALAQRLAVYAVQACPDISCDWQSLTVTETHQISRWVWRFQIRYTRL